MTMAPILLAFVTFLCFTRSLCVLQTENAVFFKLF